MERTELRDRLRKISGARRRQHQGLHTWANWLRWFRATEDQIGDTSLNHQIQNVGVALQWGCRTGRISPMKERMLDEMTTFAMIDLVTDIVMSGKSHNQANATMAIVQRVREPRGR